MKKIWDQTTLQQYISDKTQESLSLEYKAAASLDKADGKMREITKDVSAMANSSGGIIIYGIKEFDMPDKKHLPERIDPIEQGIFSKEWLEQVINNIRPKIDGLIIHPVPINTAPDHVVYVIEIPQSTTAHQATDLRYYKRYNFQAAPMEDYEIRDTMGRQQYPKIEVVFKIEFSTNKSFKLVVIARNVGKVYAQYVNSFIQVPLSLLDNLMGKLLRDRGETTIEDGVEYYEYYNDNTVRDVLDTQYNPYGLINKYGPSRYDPILPGLSHKWDITLRNDFDQITLDNLEIKWTIYADSAPPVQGKILVKDIKVTDNRKK